MAMDDFLEPEVAVAVAVTAAVASPPVRKALRRGVVYGLAGLLMAGDRISAAARDIAQKSQPSTESNPTADSSTSRPSPAPNVATG